VLRYLTDEDFDHSITRGVRRARIDIDIVRIQDVGLRTRIDPVVLEWAATQARVLLTHDARTMPSHAYARVAKGLSMPGVFVAQQDEAIGRIIDDLVLLAECSLEGEWEGRVIYLPLQ